MKKKQIKLGGKDLIAANEKVLTNSHADLITGNRKGFKNILRITVKTTSKNSAKAKALSGKEMVKK